MLCGIHFKRKEMCDMEVVGQLFANLLFQDIEKYKIKHNMIINATKNMIEVYKPDLSSLSSSVLNVANYNDAAHRCAYLHKYAPFHTVMVADMFLKAVLQNTRLFQDILSRQGPMNLCSLGGGPGSDILGVLSVLTDIFGVFQTKVAIVDCMIDWQKTFSSLIQELRSKKTYYGIMEAWAHPQYLEWIYLQCNMVNAITKKVNKALETADIVTMVKFVSAAACADTSSMIMDIFSAVRPGALILFIDNSGGGFHGIMRKAANSFKMKTMFGPLQHHQYTNSSFNEKRFGYPPCMETRITVHLWQKQYPKINSRQYHGFYNNNPPFKHQKQTVLMINKTGEKLVGKDENCSVTSHLNRTKNSPSFSKQGDIADYRMERGEVIQPFLRNSNIITETKYQSFVYQQRTFTSTCQTNPGMNLNSPASNLQTQNLPPLSTTSQCFTAYHQGENRENITYVPQKSDSRVERNSSNQLRKEVHTSLSRNSDNGVSRIFSNDPRPETIYSPPQSSKVSAPRVQTKTQPKRQLEAGVNSQTHSSTKRSLMKSENEYAMQYNNDLNDLSCGCCIIL